MEGEGEKDRQRNIERQKFIKLCRADDADDVIVVDVRAATKPLFAVCSAPLSLARTF